MQSAAYGHAGGIRVFEDTLCSELESLIDQIDAVPKPKRQ